MEKSCEETVADCDENSVPLAFGELEPPNLSGASVTVPQKHKGGRPRKGVKKIKPFRPPPVPRNINKHKWDHITDAGQRKSERKTTSIDINSLILPGLRRRRILNRTPQEQANYERVMRIFGTSSNAGLVNPVESSGIELVLDIPNYSNNVSDLHNDLSIGLVDVACGPDECELVTASNNQSDAANSDDTALYKIKENVVAELGEIKDTTVDCVESTKYGSKGLRVVVSQKVRSFVDRFNNTLNSRLSPSDRAVSKQFTDSLTMQIIKVCCNSMQSALDESKTNKQPIPDVEQFIRHTIMEFVGGMTQIKFSESTLKLTTGKTIKSSDIPRSYKSFASGLIGRNVTETWSELNGIQLSGFDALDILTSNYPTKVINAFGAYLGNKTGNVIPMGGFYFIPSHFPKTIYNGAFDAGVLDQLVSGLRNFRNSFGYMESSVSHQSGLPVNIEKTGPFYYVLCPVQNPKNGNWMLVVAECVSCSLRIFDPYQYARSLSQQKHKGEAFLTDHEKTSNEAVIWTICFMRSFLEFLKQVFPEEHKWTIFNDTWPIHESTIPINSLSVQTDVEDSGAIVCQAMEYFVGNLLQRPFLSSILSCSSNASGQWHLLRKYHFQCLSPESSEKLNAV